MNVKDTIGIYPGTLSDELCDQLIEAFHQYEEHHYQGVTASGMDKNYKDTTDFDLMKVPELEGLVEQIVDAANEKIDLYVRRYRTTDEFDTHNYLFGNGTYYPVWQLQRYEKGVGHFKSFHTEGEYSEFCDRLFAVMFYLNDVEEGGETEFLHQSLWVRPTKGTFLIWPAPWPYVHRGHVPVSNDKYILTTWLLRQEN
jgi:hypothetical protein